MNKATQREVQKVANTAASHPAFAAATLATLLRSAPTRKTYVELFPLIDQFNLRDHMDVVNGCYVARVQA